MNPKSEGKNLPIIYTWFGDTKVIAEFLFSIDDIVGALPNEVRILEIGCGVGTLGYAVKDHLEQKYNKIVRLTLTDRFIDDTARLDGVEILKVENKNLPFTDGFFDIAIARSVTQYEKTTDDEAIVLSQVKRVLKHGGYFINEAVYIDTHDEISLLKSIHKLVHKELNLQTQDELLILHREVFEKVIVASKQPLIPLITTKQMFDQRYQISDLEINAKIIDLISQFSSKNVLNIWSHGDDFGWKVKYTILICTKGYATY